ncbi:MAG: translation initiation factor IF-2 [Bacteroides sp. SM23_62_1]|nr:MAG: translation initiation factor IF-2 [Bacteroides sp. SM23_62_1]
MRLSKIAREFNVGISTIIEFLNKKGYSVDPNPNTKITPDIYELLVHEYSSDISAKKESEKLSLRALRDKKETISINDIDQQRLPPSEAEEEVLIKDTTGKVKIDHPVKETEDHPVVEKEDLKEELKLSDKEVEAVTEQVDELIEKEAQKDKQEEVKKETDLKVVGKIDLESIKKKPKGKAKVEKQKEDEVVEVQKEEPVETKDVEITEPEAEKEVVEEVQEQREEEDINFIKFEVEKLIGPTVVGKIDLPVHEIERRESEKSRKKKRKRIKKDTARVELEKKHDESPEPRTQKKVGKKKKIHSKLEVSEEEVQRQIKDTLARLSTRGKSKAVKYRREKRESISQRIQEEQRKQEEQKNIIKVTEFVSVSELASLMNVRPTEVISACMDLGLFVSINQRLDAETLLLIAEEFNYKVEFISADVQGAIIVEEDDPAELQSRPPIVTVMGHVDHGKTKLLDYIRRTNVVAGEAGGITQHIGAYSVSLDGNKQITFLDTPGHEAFTAMRARGAQATDVAIIVVAADDGVMPQTVEAINHAQAAGVPIVFAINKIDKPNANPEKIKEALANMNLTVEDWGGKYQSQEISAKNGTNIDLLLEKVLLEAELLELKANPDRSALGTVIESALDKGRGYVSTVLVQNGTLHLGDVVLAGSHFGHIKAMHNERGVKVKEAGPATPVLVLGINGAPQAGDRFNVMESDREAKELANKREQLQREQDLRTHKHITLDEIGRRIAIGNFQELNIIIKGDVDGSVEALSGSLIKLSTDEVQVNIIHKAVGQISESDILLAAASNAIIVGFQVRPSLAARKLAEKEEIDIRLYSVIYDAIEEIKSAMEGMLSPEIKEEILATLEIKEVFKITKIGTVAGCNVKEGKITRDAKVRIIRDGIVVYSGTLGSLKRFKDDVKEVTTGLECGLNIDNFNDIKTGDIIEAYKEVEVKKKL